MKKILSLVLLAVLLVSICGFAVLADEYPDCEHYGQAVTALEDGYINIPFSNGYRGFCICYGLPEAEADDTFTVDDMGLAINSTTGANISHYLKYMFTHHFNDYFTLDSDNLTYAVTDIIATQHTIWHFSDDFTGWRLDMNVIDDIKANADNVSIPDHGYTLKVNDTVLATFDFHVLKTGKASQQNFFTYKITLARYPAPEILDPTADTVLDVVEGDSKRLSVTAKYGETYQWQVDTGDGFADIPGATGETYDLPAATRDNVNYTYRCVVSNTAGSATSSEFSLKLIEPPVFTTPTEDQDLEVTVGEDITLTAEATDADSYQWQMDTGDGFADIPGATGSTYTITGLTEDGVSYKYRCTATNVAGETTSTTFSMHKKPVAPPPTGDGSHLIFFVTLATLAMLGMAAICTTRKTK